MDAFGRHASGGPTSVWCDNYKIDTKTSGFCYIRTADVSKMSYHYDTFSRRLRIRIVGGWLWQFEKSYPYGSDGVLMEHAVRLRETPKLKSKTNQAVLWILIFVGKHMLSNHRSYSSEIQLILIYEIFIHPIARLLPNVPILCKTLPNS